MRFPEDSLESIQHSLESLLRLSSSRRVHVRQSAAAGVDISRAGYVLLRRADDAGPLPMGELARATSMDPGATARQVAQLESAGLLRRAPSSADGRVSLVSVTARGRGVRRRVQSVMDEHLQGVLGDWTERDQQQLARLLDRFVEGLRARDYRPPGDAPGTRGPAVA